MKPFLPFALSLCSIAAVAAPKYNLKAPFAPKPALLTSVGQSADVEMVKVLMERSGVPFHANPKVKAEDLAASGARTLVLAIGGSSKGLGAAGLSAEVELKRSKALVVEARKRGMKIIGVHVGGDSRRGELSDKFIDVSVPHCDYVIVVADGNKDGHFTKLCGTQIPLDSVDKITKVGEPLSLAFVK